MEKQAPCLPDFDQIARALVDALQGETSGIIILDSIDAEPLIAEQLRLVWNARGAADIEAAKEAENDRYGAPYPDLAAIVEDISSLDRQE